MDVCLNDPPHVGDELRFSACFWSQQHPGEPVPAERVIPVAADELETAGPVGSARTEVG
jgi:peptide/nickel transport system ATP-binding protein